MAVLAPMPMASERIATIGETGIFTDPAKRIAQILDSRIEDRQTALIAIAFLCRFDAAELKPGPAIRFFRRDTAADVVFGEQLDMGIEFLGEIAFAALAGRLPSKRFQSRRSVRIMLSSFQRKEARDDFGRLRPLAHFRGKLFLAGLRDPVELGAAIVLRHAPFRRDGAFLFELEENRVERAVVDGQQVVAGLLDAARDAISVLRPHGIERLEDHEGQRALPDFRLRTHIGFPNEYGRIPVGKQQDIGSAMRP